jgi:hypothetical protein
MKTFTQFLKESKDDSWAEYPTLDKKVNHNYYWTYIINNTTVWVMKGNTPIKPYTSAKAAKSAITRLENKESAERYKEKYGKGA